MGQKKKTMPNERQSERRTILRNSPIAGGIGPTQTHLYMDGTKLMGQQYDGVAKTIIDFSAIPATTPVGSMTQYGGDTAPSGWLMCDGNSLLKASYADLFSVIAYKYGGSGDNFNLPDLRGRIPVHRKSTDTAFDTLGETGGSTDAGIPAHSHTATLDSSNWDGYLQAHETWLWPIKDLDAPQHNSTGSLDTTMGLSAYGAGTDCAVAYTHLTLPTKRIV